jgi:hypothetical protein
MKRKLAKAVSRWIKPALEFGWSRWLDGVEAQAEEKAKYEAAQAQAEAQMGAARRMIFKMMMATLVIAFEGWRSKAQEQQQGRAKCSKIIHRMQCASLGRAFDSFCERVEESKETQRKLAGALSRWHTPALQFGWDGWLEYLDVEASERSNAANEINARRLKELEDSMLSLGSAGEEALKDAVEQAQRAKAAQDRQRMETVRRVVTKMMKAAMANAFEGWWGAAEKQRGGRDKCSKIIRRMQRAGLSRAFDGFCERVEDSKEMKRKLAKAVSRWIKPALEFGWSGWVNFIIADRQLEIEQQFGAREVALKAEIDRLRKEAERQKELRAVDMLRVQEEMCRAREQQESEIEVQQASLKAEFDRRQKDADREREEREADVRSQLHALEADLAREVRTAARRMKELQDLGSGFCTPRDEASMNLDLSTNMDRKSLPVHNGHNGKFYNANAKTYELVNSQYDADETRHDRGPLQVDHLLEAQTRLAELRAHRSGLGAKIHAKLAQVNLTLEEYTLPQMQSKELSSSALLRDSRDATARRLKRLQKELQSADRQSRPQPINTVLENLKEVRPQQGPHCHFDGAPVLSTHLPKGYSVPRHPKTALSPRTEEIKIIIDSLKETRGRGIKVPVLAVGQDGVCGRPGWFSS